MQQRTEHIQIPLLLTYQATMVPTGEETTQVQSSKWLRYTVYTKKKKQNKKKRTHCYRNIIGISETKILLIGWSLIVCLYTKGKTNQTIQALFSSKVHSKSSERCVRALQKRDRGLKY